MKLLRYAAICATFLALLVVMLGAYTRLTDAGLGCPDWPGCYGHMVLPSAQNELMSAQDQYPSIPIESRKAWTEMAHRYAAGTLVLLVVFIVSAVIVLRRQGKNVPWVILPCLLLLIGFQAALGMWTVTLKLLPVVVMGHLLGGILILTCLSYFCWQSFETRRSKTKTPPPNQTLRPATPGLRPATPDLRPATCSRDPERHDQLKGSRMTQADYWRWWINLGILIVFCQIALGGWVSSNYAGMACVGFPRCNFVWWPTLHLAQGFNLFSTIGANYQGGVLDAEVRVTIQFIHRIGALVTAGYMVLLSGMMLAYVKNRALRIAALFAVVFVLTQFALGVINVIYLLPLWAAVAHNAVAALLLVSVVSMRYFTTAGALHASQS